MVEFSSASDNLTARSEFESVLQRFDRLWHSNDPPEISDFLHQMPDSRRELLVELVHADLEYRLARDPSTQLERYFDVYPELREDRHVVLELIVQEYRLRSQHQEVTLDEYRTRFPEFDAELGPLLSTSLDGYSDLAARIERLLRGAVREFGAISPLPGDVLGRYEIVRLIGRGAFGTVYLARDTQLNRRVAIKMPCAAVSMSPRARSRLLREARHVARLEHPSIVRIWDVGLETGSIYLVSAFIDGETLADRMQSSEFSHSAAAHLLAAVAEALHFAHQQGIVHRDVKPSNLILDESRKPYLTDFGLSRCDEDESLLTLDGETLGTPAYISPEQAAGKARQADARTDVYSLGVVMYELLTNQLPFQGSRQAIIQNVINEEPLRVRHVDPRVPRDLETICMKAMAKEPHHRFQSAAEMANELQRFLRGEPLQSRPIGRVLRIVRRCWRNPRSSGAMACSALIAVLATAAIAWNASRTRSYQELAEQHRQASLETGVVAREMVDQMFRQIDLEMGHSAEAESIRQRLATETEKYFLQIAESRPNDLTAQAMLADAVYRVANMNYVVGADVDAKQRYADAMGRWRKLFEQNPSETDFQYRLVKACQRLSGSQIRIGEYDEAGESMELAVQLAEDLVKRFPKQAGLREKLADVYVGLGGLRDITGPLEAKREALIKAKHQFEQLTRIEPLHNGYRRRLAELYVRIGAMGRTIGRGSFLSVPDRDVSLYDLGLLERAQTIQQQLVDQGREMPWVAADLCLTLSAIGMWKFFSGDAKGFREYSAQSSNVLRQTVSEYPDVNNLRFLLAKNLCSDALHEIRLDSHAYALTLLDESMQHYRSYLDRRPLHAETLIHLAATLILAGRSSETLGNKATADAKFQEAKAALQRAERHAQTNARVQAGVDELRAAMDGHLR